MPTTIFGIRHHGPGCARSLVDALTALRPDAVLIEGPPDADDELAAAALAGMKPPVALLVHRTDEPSQAVFYPFAEFSPEWQALRWAQANQATVRFIDLPWVHRFALAEAAKAPPPAPAPDPAVGDTPTPDPVVAESDQGDEDGDAAPELSPEELRLLRLRRDPLQVLATADGYSDSERWWNDRVEERADAAGMFTAILEAMTAIRGDLALPEADDELRREAWMRRCLRQASKDGFANIAVVCGAWHAPVLAKMPTATADNEKLLRLPKVKVGVTWVPWTYERLTTESGYGAGIDAPGWYEHLWHYRQDPALTIRWMTRMARCLRAHDLASSSAHIIEGVRLAESLAAMRGRPIPGLPEMNEAVLSVFCQGDATPLRLIRRELMVGEAMGEVPEGVARVPLQQDLEAQQKSLRLKPTPTATQLELDLREPNGLARSRLLYRLQALEIPWGKRDHATGGKGTFKENWTLLWQPQFAISLISAARFGNTVASAAAKALAQAARQNPELAHLATLLELALLADLPQAIQQLMRDIAAEAARGDDVLRLLHAVPPLARLARYGNVRQTDSDQVGHIIAGFMGRIHAGLLTALAGIDDEAAAVFDDACRGYHAALDLLESPGREAWQQVLHRLRQSPAAHPRLGGLAARLLLDGGTLPPDAAARCLQVALSRGEEPARAGAWIEGFLRGSGLILVHDPQLLPLLHAWVIQLGPEHFTAILPLLRRTFGTFTQPERERLAQRVAQGLAASGQGQERATTAWELHAERAAKPLPLALSLLGLVPEKRTP